LQIGRLRFRRRLGACAAGSPATQAFFAPDQLLQAAEPTVSIANDNVVILEFLLTAAADSVNSNSARLILADLRRRKTIAHRVAFRTVAVKALASAVH
jgi:hypothetical protein